MLIFKWVENCYQEFQSRALSRCWLKHSSLLCAVCLFSFCSADCFMHARHSQAIGSEGLKTVRHWACHTGCSQSIFPSALPRTHSTWIYPRGRAGGMLYLPWMLVSCLYYVLLTNTSCREVEGRTKNKTDCNPYPPTQRDPLYSQVSFAQLLST